MEMNKSSILDFLSETNIIEIPIWHREFIWQEAQVMQLYEDIISVINAPNLGSHFLGIIIQQPLPKIFSAVRLVDGAQRLLSISVFLAALCDYFGSENYKQALLFSQNSSQKSVKIRCLNQPEAEYENILMNKDYPFIANSSYSKLYRFFYSHIESNQYHLEDYFNALRRFEIIDLELSSRDNGQLIFDSINATGMKLDFFEKIKNYIFMGLEDTEQFEIWSKYWKPIDMLFKQDEETFKKFLISYISMQTENVVNADNLCISFNKFYNFKRKYKKSKEIVNEIFKFAQYFIRIKNADFSQEIAVEMEKIVEIYDEAELYSFLFELTDDFQNDLIPKRTYIDILNNTYNYLKEKQENDEKVDFSNLSKSISKILTKKYEQEI